MASEQGLFVVRNLEKDFKRPVIDSLVTNVSVYNDTVYALLENSVFKISPDGKNDACTQRTVLLVCSRTRQG